MVEEVEISFSSPRKPIVLTNLSSVREGVSQNWRSARRVKKEKLLPLGTTK